MTKKNKENDYQREVRLGRDLKGKNLFLGLLAEAIMEIETVGLNQIHPDDDGIGERLVFFVKFARSPEQRSIYRQVNSYSEGDIFNVTGNYRIPFSCTMIPKSLVSENRIKINGHDSTVLEGFKKSFIRGEEAD